MQVYKAWSVATSRACQGEAEPAVPHVLDTGPHPRVLVLPPLNIVVKRRSQPAAKSPCPCPLRPEPPAPASPAPASASSRAPAASPAPGTESRPCTLTPASAEATEAWMRRAIGASLVARNVGTEALATVLAGRLDASLAASMRRLRDSGQLAGAIDAALHSEGLCARPDVPLERILRSALRRYELRPWLEALR